MAGLEAGLASPLIPFLPAHACRKDTMYRERADLETAEVARASDLKAADQWG